MRTQQGMVKTQDKQEQRDNTTHRPAVGRELVLLDPGRAVAVEEVTLESCHGKRDASRAKTMTWQREK